MHESPVTSSEVVQMLILAFTGTEGLITTSGGVNVQEEFAGSPEQDKRTTSLNPFKGVTVTV